LSEIRVKTKKVLEEYLERILAVYALRLLKMKYTLKELSRKVDLQPTTLSKYYNGLVLPDTYNSHTILALYYNHRREVYATIMQRGRWDLLALALGISLYYYMNSDMLNEEVDYIASLQDPSHLIAIMISQIHNIENITLILHPTYIPVTSSCKLHEFKEDFVYKATVICASPRRSLRDKTVILIEPFLYPQNYTDYAINYLVSEGAKEIMLVTHGDCSKQKAYEYPVKLICL
jgi:hypothetical protein